MIGQAHVTEPLMTALRTGRIGHAYLFSGPRGCGKTTSARILARCLNCAEGPTDTPCGVCPSCVELSRDGGGSLDVVEIDAASHGGVDDARELRERAVFAPARDRFKIFIIDEAHMVTSGGFNALLKIVEEPPPHVKFVFATTEPEKVIGTIRSRTHHYPFRLIAPGTLVDYAQQLVDSEGVRVEPGVLPLVVRAGGGSVRDSLSILDQLIAGSEGDEVTLDRATGLLGYTGAELLDEVVAAFGAHDSGAAFAAADRVVQTGQDPRRFVEDLLERLRDLIVVSATSVQGASAVFRGVPIDRLQRMYQQSQAFGRGELSRIADTVSEALDRMSGATAPRLHLELMIARALVAQEAFGVPGAAQADPAAAGSASASAGSGQSGSAGQGPATPMPGAAQEPAVAGAQAATAHAQSAEPQAAQAQAAAPQASAPVTPAPVTPAPVTPAPVTPAPVTPAAAAQPAASGPEVDIVSTLRSARDFLRNDGAGASAEPRQAAPRVEPPAAAPASDPEPASGEPASAEPAPSAPDADPAAQATAQPEPVALDELREVWPALLEEILEEDRDAWNAVKGVQPLAIDGDVLTIGIASRTDLEAFKAAGAAPLREAIAAAVGIRVKYVPKPMPAGMQASTERESTPDPEPSPQADPAQGSALDPAPSHGSASGPGPVPEAATASPTPEVPAPARVGEFGDPGFRPDRDPDADPAYDPDLRDDDEDPYATGDPYGAGPGEEGAPFAPEVEAEVADPSAAGRSTGEPGTADAGDGGGGDVPAAGAGGADADAAVAGDEAEADPPSVTPSASPPLPAPTALPTGNRYGESVVRELLGARFIEERPLPQDGE